MYTIFFTINCVEQLYFPAKSVEQMTVEQSNFFFLKVKLLESSSSPKINWIRANDKKNIIARMVSSNNKIVSSRFFEQSQFEQMIMSLYLYLFTFFNSFSSNLRFMFLFLTLPWPHFCSETYLNEFQNEFKAFKTNQASQQAKQIIPSTWIPRTHARITAHW